MTSDILAPRAIEIPLLARQAEFAKDLTYSIPNITDQDFWLALRSTFTALIGERSTLTERQVVGSQITNVKDSLNVLLTFCTRSFVRGIVVQNLAFQARIHQELIASISISPDRAYGALSNLITRNPDLVSSVQQAFFTSNAVKHLASDSTPTNMLLFFRNSIASRDHTEAVAHCREIVSSELFVHLVTAINLDEDPHDADIVLRERLVQACISTFLDTGLLKLCISKLRATDTTEHLPNALGLFYYLVSCYCEDLQSDDTDKRLEASSALLLAQELRTAVAALSSSLTADKPAKDDTASPGQRTAVDTGNLWMGLTHLVHALSELTAKDESLLQAELASYVPDVVKLLELAQIHIPRQKPSLSNAAQGLFAPKGIKRYCLGFIAHMAYKNRAVQDLVRDSSGLPLILAQSHVDDANPYLLEQATVCINFLLENNQENQDLVDTLKPVAVQKDNELSQFGYAASTQESSNGANNAPEGSRITEV